MSYTQFYRAPAASIWDQFADEPEFFDDDVEDVDDFEDVQVQPLGELIALHKIQMAGLLQPRRHSEAALYERQAAIEDLRDSVRHYLAKQRDEDYEYPVGRPVWEQKHSFGAKGPKVLYDIVHYDADNNLIYLQERLPTGGANLMAIKSKRDWKDRLDNAHNPSTVWLTPREREILKKKQRMATLVQTLTTGGLALAGFGMGGPLGAAIGGAAGSALGEAISPTPGKHWTAGRALSKAGTAALVSGLAPVIFSGIPATAATIGGAWVGYAKSDN